MEYTVNKLENAKADVHLSFGASDIEQAYTKAYKKAATKAKINGFRPGKAPLEMVKKMLGESVAEDAITILLNEAITDLIPKFDFKPYNQPKIEIEKFERNEALVAKATFELAPEVKLGNYKNLPIQAFDFQIQESDLESHLKEIQYQLAKNIAKEAGEVVEDGDYVEFDLLSKNEEGIIVQQGEGTRYYLGRTDVNKELEKNFLGMQEGEEKKFTFTYGTDYPNKDLAGKTLNFEVKMKGIFKVSLPNLDDDLAKEWNESANIDELKSKIRESIQTNTQNRLNELYYDRLLNYVIDNSTYTLPESMIKEEVDNIFHRTLHDYGMEHMSMEKFAELAKADVEEIRKSYEERAIRNIKGYLTLYEIAKAETIEVSPEEFRAKLTDYQNRVGKDKINQQNANNIVRNLHDNMLFDKIFGFLYENSDKKIESGVSLSRVNEIITTSNKE